MFAVLTERSFDTYKHMNAARASGPTLDQQSARLQPSLSPAGPLPALVVDLDGTLIKTDLLFEAICRLLREEPSALFAIPFWLLKGGAHLKRELARRVQLDPALLPYRTDVLDWVRAERGKGRQIVLATGSDERLAKAVANYLKVFDLVQASDGATNLSGENKRTRVVAEFGNKGFDYVGNESRDLPVWSSARKAIVVNPNPGFIQTVAKVATIEKSFLDRGANLSEYLKALRPQQWSKNVLVFVPLFAAHFFNQPALLARTIIAFMAFCCCASSGYLINDLCDLPADRHHPTKRLRLFASGRLPLAYALAMAPILAALGCILAALLSEASLGILVLYFALTVAYSVRLKKVVLLDVIILASFYTLRVIGGGVAIAIWPSVWLVGFSMFLFISLAFMKRYAELVIMRAVDGDHATARAYRLSDTELLATKGTVSAYACVLVLAIYIAGGAVKTLYSTHQVLWFVCPLLLYWIGYLWLVAHRGEMQQDPMVFALHNRTSRILILLMVAAALIAI